MLPSLEKISGFVLGLSEGCNVFEGKSLCSSVCLGWGCLFKEVLRFGFLVAGGGLCRLIRLGRKRRCAGKFGLRDLYGMKASVSFRFVALSLRVGSFSTTVKLWFGWNECL